MAERFLMIESVGGRTLVDVTDDGVFVPSGLPEADLRLAVVTLGEHVRGFHRAAKSSPSALAARMRLDASTLSRNLQPLVAAGWIELLPGPDARSRLVQATDAGRDKRAEAQRRWRVAQEQLNATLGLQRVAALHALVDDCGALLAPAPPEETP